MKDTRTLFFEAHTREDKTVKGSAFATYMFMEDVVRDTGCSLYKASQFVHIEVTEKLGVKRSVATLRSYHTVCAWLIQEAGSIDWVKDRSFAMHSSAMKAGWKRARLIREPFPQKRQGFMSRSAEARIRAGLTEATNGIVILEAEIRVSKGATRRELTDALNTLAGLNTMRERFLHAARG